MDSAVANLIKSFAIEPIKLADARASSGKLVALRLEPYIAIPLFQVAIELKTEKSYFPTEKVRYRYAFTMDGITLYLEDAKFGSRLLIAEKDFVGKTKQRVYNLLSASRKLASSLEDSNKLIPSHHSRLGWYVEYALTAYQEAIKPIDPKLTKGEGIAPAWNAQIRRNQRIVYATANYLAALFSYFEYLFYYLYAFDSKKPYIDIDDFQRESMQTKLSWYFRGKPLDRLQQGLRLRKLLLHGFISSRADGTHITFGDVGYMAPTGTITIESLFFETEKEFGSLVEDLDEIFKSVSSAKTLTKPRLYAGSGLTLRWEKDAFAEYRKMAKLDIKLFKEAITDEARLLDMFDNYER